MDLGAGGIDLDQDHERERDYDHVDDYDYECDYEHEDARGYVAREPQHKAIAPGEGSNLWSLAYTDE